MMLVISIVSIVSIVSIILGNLPVACHVFVESKVESVLIENSIRIRTFVENFKFNTNPNEQNTNSDKCNINNYNESCFICDYELLEISHNKQFLICNSEITMNNNELKNILSYRFSQYNNLKINQNIPDYSLTEKILKNKILTVCSPKDFLLKNNVFIHANQILLQGLNYISNLFPINILWIPTGNHDDLGMTEEEEQMFVKRRDDCDLIVFFTKRFNEIFKFGDQTDRFVLTKINENKVKLDIFVNNEFENNYKYTLLEIIKYLLFVIGLNNKVDNLQSIAGMNKTNIYPTIITNYDYNVIYNLYKGMVKTYKNDQKIYLNNNFSKWLPGKKYDKKNKNIIDSFTINNEFNLFDENADYDDNYDNSNNNKFDNLEEIDKNSLDFVGKVLKYESCDVRKNYLNNYMLEDLKIKDDENYYIWMILFITAFIVITLLLIKYIYNVKKIEKKGDRVEEEEKL